MWWYDNGVTVEAHGWGPELQGTALRSNTCPPSLVRPTPSLAAASATVNNTLSVGATAEGFRRFRTPDL